MTSKAISLFCGLLLAGLSLLAQHTPPEYSTMQTMNLSTPSPSVTSSARDFDFLTGDWVLQNHQLKDRLSGCKEWVDFPATQSMSNILLGTGNRDNFLATVNGKPFEGITLRLFNPQTRLWSIYWADSHSGTLEPPVLGSFDGNTGTFYGQDTFRGQAIQVKFSWDKTDPQHPIWSQAFSADGGSTWEWNWYMYFKRP